MAAVSKPNLVYRITKLVARFVLRLICQIEVVGREKVPLEGPVIIAANHLSWLDPPAIGLVLPRPISYIARADLFDNRFLGWLLPRLYVIPVERGSGDLAAVKAAIRTLRNGMAFGIFPEGTRSRSGKLQPFKTGTAAIAIRTGAPVLPVAVIGSDKIWPPGGKIHLGRKLKIVFGDPIDLSRYAGKLDKPHLEDATREIEMAVAKLLPPEYLPEGYLTGSGKLTETPENAGLA
ncbi:lysophospholipid acyltransferase family protein [Oceanithermus sp.]